MTQRPLLDAVLGAHLAFDLLAWAAAAAVGVAVWRWRLARQYQPLLVRVGRGYFAALVAYALIMLGGRRHGDA